MRESTWSWTLEADGEAIAGCAQTSADVTALVPDQNLGGMRRCEGGKIEFRLRG
jgi:hypothetical protein